MFFAEDVDTGDKFSAVDIDTGGAPWVENIFPIFRDEQIRNVAYKLSGAREKMIHQKSEVKFLWLCPFKGRW